MLPSIIRSGGFTLNQQVSQFEPSSIAIFDNKELGLGGGPTIADLDTFDSRMLASDGSIAEIQKSDSQPNIYSPEIGENKVSSSHRKLENQ